MRLRLILLLAASVLGRAAGFEYLHVTFP